MSLKMILLLIFTIQKTVMAQIMAAMGLPRCCTCAEIVSCMDRLMCDKQNMFMACKQQCGMRHIPNQFKRVDQCYQQFYTQNVAEGKKIQACVNAVPSICQVGNPSTGGKAAKFRQRYSVLQQNRGRRQVLSTGSMPAMAMASMKPVVSTGLGLMTNVAPGSMGMGSMGMGSMGMGSMGMGSTGMGSMGMGSMGMGSMGMGSMGIMGSMVSMMTAPANTSTTKRMPKIPMPPIFNVFNGCIMTCLMSQRVAAMKGNVITDVDDALTCSQMQRCYLNQTAMSVARSQCETKLNHTKAMDTISLQKLQCIQAVFASESPALQAQRAAPSLVAMSKSASYLNSSSIYVPPQWYQVVVQFYGR